MARLLLEEKQADRAECQQRLPSSPVTSHCNVCIQFASSATHSLNRRRVTDWTDGRMEDGRMEKGQLSTCSPGESSDSISPLAIDQRVWTLLQVTCDENREGEERECTRHWANDAHFSSQQQPGWTRQDQEHFLAPLRSLCSCQSRINRVIASSPRPRAKTAAAAADDPLSLLQEQLMCRFRLVRPSVTLHPHSPRPGESTTPQQDQQRRR